MIFLKLRYPNYQICFSIFEKSRRNKIGVSIREEEIYKNLGEELEGRKEAKEETPRPTWHSFPPVPIINRVLHGGEGASSRERTKDARVPNGI